MIVVMHRPPLKRIDFTLKRKPKPEEFDFNPASSELVKIAARIEQDRVWSLVQQSARGCNGVET